MLKDKLVDQAVASLARSGYDFVDCRGSRSSFDVLGKKGDKLILVKVLSNLEGLSRQAVSQLKRVAKLLDGVPYIVSLRMKASKLSDGVLYDRYGVYASSAQTFGEILSDGCPRVYSTRGNYLVHLDTHVLSEARRRRGLTQESLANELGVTKQSVYRYESSGRVSLEIFDRLLRFFEGDDLTAKKFELTYDQPEKQSNPAYHANSLKEKVAMDLVKIGLETTLTNAPFDIVASKKRRFYTVVSNDYRRLSDKISMLEDITHIVGGYGVCVSQRRIRSEASVITPEQLLAVKSPRELFKLITNQ